MNSIYVRIFSLFRVILCQNKYQHLPPDVHNNNLSCATPVTSGLEGGVIEPQNYQTGIALVWPAAFAGTN